MLLFRCEFTHNELTALKNYLPQDEYCIIGGPGERDYYGVIEEGSHGRLLDILSGETLSMLEYVDEDELKRFVSVEEVVEIIGKCELIDKFR